MKISVVTAVYNRRDTIADALRSVQAQTYAPVEHVIQDGGSTDGTLEELARHFRPELSLETARDGGIYPAINRGIARSTGDVVGLLHSDDFFAHDKVLEKVAHAFRDPRVDGVYGDLDYVSHRNPSRVVRHWSSGAYEPGKLMRGWMPPHPTLYLRRAVFESFGTYDPAFRISADYDAILRWLVRGKIRLAYIPEVLVKMRTGGESNKSLECVLRKSREDLRAIRRNEIGGVRTLMLKNALKVSQFVTRQGHTG
ncbi:glycosyltransferase family 2 protein [Cereibacter sphaeroides]|uniref:glycosyltransferase family 2 protein n=1 Tax=Cereibacter sphaeroides TaxID=1063 RepID=UPI003FCD9817